MICSKCGKSNEDNFRFCQYCGTPTGQNPSGVMKSSTSDPVPASLPAPGQIEILSAIESAASPLSVDQDDWSIDGVPETVFDNAGPDISLASGFNEEEDKMRSTQNGRISVAQQMVESVVSISPASRICQNCGEAVPEGHKFCGNCGRRFDVETPNAEPVQVDTSNENGPRVVRRGFIGQNISQELDSSAKFALYHMNDDNTIGDEIPLVEGENVIGRMSSSPLKADRFVSPQHVRITCRGNTAVIEDCGSLNGTFQKLNNESITLHNGDTFRIGEELLSYVHGNSKQQILLPRDNDPTTLIGGVESEGWGYLSSILGPYSEGDVYRLSKPVVTLGRTSADILFPRDGFVSGRHASLRASSDGAILTDLNSSNGTFIKLEPKFPVTVTGDFYILVGNQLLYLTLNRVR